MSCQKFSFSTFISLYKIPRETHERLLWEKIYDMEYMENFGMCNFLTACIQFSQFYVNVCATWMNQNIVYCVITLMNNIKLFLFSVWNVRIRHDTHRKLMYEVAKVIENILNVCLGEITWVGNWMSMWGAMWSVVDVKMTNGKLVDFILVHINSQAHVYELLTH